VYAIVAAAFATPTFTAVLVAALLATVCACGYDALKRHPEHVFEREKWADGDAEDPDSGAAQGGPGETLLPGSRRRRPSLGNQQMKKMQRRMSTFATHAVKGDLAAALGGGRSLAELAQDALDDEDAALYALPPLELPAAALLLGGPSLPPPFCVPTSGSGRVLYRGKFEGVVVACKRCSGVGSLAGDLLGAFNREVNILADLGHPNVLQVLGLCVDAAVGSNCGAPAHDAAATRGTVTLAGASGPSGTIGRGDEDEEGDNEWTREPTRNDPLVVTVLCGGGTLAEYYPISFF
jgi:hypothetical protein